jgi:hypothetical protein
MGHRDGSAAIPFAAIGSALVHRAPSSTSAVEVCVGIALHVAMMFVWSAAGIWLYEHLIWRKTLAALAVAMAHFGLSGLVARWSGFGLASEVSLGDRLVFGVVFCVALRVGLRFAFHSREMHDDVARQRAHPL